MSGHQRLAQSRARAAHDSAGSGQRSSAEGRRGVAPARPGPLHAAGPAVPLVQTKVEIGAPNDPYEREADAVADRVVSGGKVPALSSVASGGGLGVAQTKAAAAQQTDEEKKKEAVQAKEAAEEEKKQALQTKEQAEEEKKAAVAKAGAEQEQLKAAKAAGETKKEKEKQPVQAKAEAAPKQEEKKPVQTKTEAAPKQEEKKPVQAKTEAAPKQEEKKPVQTKTEAAPKQEEKKPVQTKGDGSGGASSTAQAAASRAISNKSAGEPMATSTRQALEPAFGADLSHVRVHQGAQAQEAASDMGARAFAHGNDIWLGKGESQSDTKLMAHETTHVFQQGSAVRRANATTNAGGGGGGGGNPGGAGGANVLGADDPGEAGSGYIQFRKLPVPKSKWTRHRALYEGALKRPANYSRTVDTQREDWKNAIGPTKIQSKLQTKLTREHAAPAPYVVQVGPHYFIGDATAVAKDLSVASWPHSNHRGHKAYHVDHIKELQLEGTNDPATNMELLEGNINSESGRLIDQAVDTKLKGFMAQHPDVPVPGNGVTDRLRHLKANNEIRFTNGEEGQGRVGGRDDYWIKSEIDDLAHLGGADLSDVRVIQQGLAGLGGPNSVLVFSSESGGIPKSFKKSPAVEPNEARWITPYRLVEKNFDQAAAGDRLGTLGFDIPDNPTWQPVPMRRQFLVQRLNGAENVGFISKNTIKSQMKQDLVKKKLSPIEIDDFDIRPDVGAYVRGRVLPTLPLFANLGLEFELAGSDFSLFREFNADDLKLPRPFKATECSLTLGISTQRGLVIGGRLGFAIDKVGDGYLAGARSNSGGPEFEGGFNFDSKLFDPAAVRVGYKDEKWSFGGHIGVRQGKVKGIRSAEVDIAYSEGNLTATGTVQPAIPGVQQGNLAITHNETDGLIIAGSLQLADIPGLRSGTVQATVQRKPDGKYSVKATGTGQPAIPGVNSEFRVAYEDGVFTAEATASYQRGMLSGTLQAGITNRPVDPNTGQPGGEPVENRPLTIYGGGSLTLRITPWLQGMAGVKFRPDGEIEVTGRISLPSSFTLFNEKAINKELLSLHLDIPIVGVAFAGQRIGIFATVGGSLSANASIGPGELQEAALTVQYNPAHEDQTRVEGAAKLHIPAQAGLRLAVNGGVGVGIPLVSAQAGLEIGGSLGLAGAVDASVNVAWTPTQGVKLDALGEIYVQPKFTFDVSAYAKVEAGIGWFSVDLYNERWKLASFEYGSNLRFGIKFPIHYEDGKPFNLSLSDVEFVVPDVDPMAILGDLVKRVTG